jgi:hypothetical protein
MLQINYGLTIFKQYDPMHFCITDLLTYFCITDLFLHYWPTYLFLLGTLAFGQCSLTIVIGTSNSTQNGRQPTWAELQLLFLVFIVLLK